MFCISYLHSMEVNYRIDQIAAGIKKPPMWKITFADPVRNCRSIFAPFRYFSIEIFYGRAGFEKKAQEEVVAFPRKFRFPAEFNAYLYEMWEFVNPKG